MLIKNLINTKSELRFSYTVSASNIGKFNWHVTCYNKVTPFHKSLANTSTNNVAAH